MQKIIPVLLVLSLISLAGKSQCDASFSYATNQNTVSFTPVSTGQYIRHTWYFGDGAVVNYPVSPVHQYAHPGQYTVGHVVIDSVNNCIDSSLQVVSIDSVPTTCQVNFIFTKTIDSLAHYNFYSQISLSGGTLQHIVWTINGVQVSSAEAFAYTFHQAGRYSVCVKITSSSGCVAEKCDSIDFQPYGNCNLASSFTHIADSVQSRLIYFSASPDQPGLEYTWHFGDSYGGTGKNTSHLYTHAGTYNVKLIVTDSVNGCRDTTLQAVQVTVPVSQSCTASFTYTINQVGQTSFTGVSNQPVISQVWTIVKIADSLQYVVLTAIDPVYNFPDTGYYYVCLSLATQMGCTANYCSMIRVDTIANRAITSVPSYPNPVSGESAVQLNVEMPKAGILSYTVSNLNGHIVYQSRREGLQGANIITIPVQQLGRGQYFIDIMFDNKHKRSRFQKL